MILVRMSRTSLVVLAVVCADATQLCNDAVAQTIDRPKASSDFKGVKRKPVTLAHCYQFDMGSQSGRGYRIYVAEPRGKTPEGGWPVVYLLDGNLHFTTMVAAVERQSRGGFGAVVVGVGYPTDDVESQRLLRAYDLTPPTSDEWKAKRAGGMADLPTGGHDEFLRFLNEELKPVVEKAYPIDRSRQAIFGHSFGGLFVLHALFTSTESFQTYIASSPSIWWNDQSILEEEKRFRESKPKELRARLLVTVGALEQPPAQRRQADRSQQLNQRRIVGLAEELTLRLAESKLDGLKVQFREFAEEHHGSVVLPAASRGVQFAMSE